MLNPSRNGAGVDRAIAHRDNRKKRTGRKRQYHLESLESRRLLSYSFVYMNTQNVTVNETGGNDSFIVAEIGKNLEFSVDGGQTFSQSWGANGQTVLASSTTTVAINLASAVNSHVGLGDALSAASNNLALFVLNAPLVANTDSLLVDDSTTGANNAGPGVYTFGEVLGTNLTSNNGINVSNTNVSNLGGGVTLLGSPANDSTFVLRSAVPVSIVGGAGPNFVDVGLNGTLNLDGALAIYEHGDAAAINIDDPFDTTHSTATLDNLSGNINAPFEVKGLSNFPIEYGAGVTALTINGGTFGAAGVNYDVNNTQSGTTTTINGGPNQNFIDLSNAAEANGLDNLLGQVSVHGSTSRTDVVTLDDSDANFNDNYTITEFSVSRRVFGGLLYDDNIGTLNLLAENTLGTNGSNTININNTADNVTTNVEGQGGVDTINVNDTGVLGMLNVTTGNTDGSTVNVVAGNQPVNVTLAAQDMVNIGSTGNAGTMGRIEGAVDITDPTALYSLAFHDENDRTGHLWSLDNDDVANTASVALTGGIATTSYRPGDLNSPLTIDGGSGGNTFNVNNTTAIVVTALNTGTGDDAVNVFATGDNTLNIQGQDGKDTVTLGAAALVGMQDVNGTINVENVNGSTTLILDDSEGSVGQTASLANDGKTGTVTGLSATTINYSDSDIRSLTVDGGSGGNTFTINGTLQSANTTVNTGTGDNTVNIAAFGVADGTTLFIDDGPGTNTLNFDAGGEAPTIKAGGASGEVLITIPGAGTVDANNQPQTNITDAGPLTITAGAPLTVDGVAGYPLVDANVATFTLPITAVLPAPAVGFPASDFSASIDWGDGTPPTAGTITQDTTVPSLYSISGTHTFADVGSYTVANAVTFAGGVLATLVNGVPISITYGPAGPTVGNSATANVIADTLTVSALPIFGTEGQIIAAAPIATFVDAAGAAPLADYSASISITNSSGFSLLLAAASITQNGTTAPFTVNAPAFTLPEEGTYQVLVSVTDSAGAAPVTYSGGSLAVITDAALTAGPMVLLAANTGVALPAATIVGTFTDANPQAPASDFTDTINWGDGSPDSPGAITQPGGIGTPFVVNGTHMYAQPSNLLVPSGYAIAIVVTDKGGSTVTLTGTVDVTDLPVTGTTSPGFTAVEGMNTGMILLARFTNPNTLATSSDVTASVPIGGWGDGEASAPGGPLIVQQIGVTPSTSPVPGQPIFDVFGSHTYGSLTSSGSALPLRFTINVTTLGGVTTAMTSPVGGGVTVLDAPLTAQMGNAIAGSAGVSTATVTIGSFVDADTAATSADFTARPGMTEVFWGDGTATALTPANFTATSSANGVVFSILAAHTYADEGKYTITINVTDDGGQTTAIFTTASIATFHNTILAFAPNNAGFVSQAAGVVPTAIPPPHTAAIHKVVASHKAKPARTLIHLVQRARAHDAAKKVIIAETRPRRSHE